MNIQFDTICKNIHVIQDDIKAGKLIDDLQIIHRLSQDNIMMNVLLFCLEGVPQEIIKNFSDPIMQQKYASGEEDIRFNVWLPKCKVLSQQKLRDKVIDAKK